MKVSRHGLLLAGILLLGLTLRFWNLNAKPIWLDETITALFSLGRTYLDVPLGRVFAIADLEPVFTLNSATTCPQIVTAVSTQSVHPPLFFCWLHGWLVWLQWLPKSWLWKLRAFPALLGVVAIAAVYQLNRVAFSARAGLLGAALMAVSPFAVYLSQEARHYTLPIVLVTLALLGLYQILLDLQHPSRRPAIWLGWVAVNSLGFYVHYFFILSFFAQVVTLLLCVWHLPSLTAAQPATRLPMAKLPLLQRFNPSAFWAIGLAVSAVCLTYLPWLPTFAQHLSRPETDWLQPANDGWLNLIAPLYQLAIGWILMLIALPVERQSGWVEVASGITMILFAGWLTWLGQKRLRRLWAAAPTRLATQMLGIYVLAVLVAFLAIVYLLNKDITQVPRYNFIYFPAVCALLAAGLSLPPVGRALTEPAIPRRWRGNRQTLHPDQQKILWFQPPYSVRPAAIVLLTALLSSVLVVSDLVFPKPYDPDRVAKTLWVDPERPHLVAVAYADLQDVALGVSFALALGDQIDQSDEVESAKWVFLERSKKTKGYKPVWHALTELEPTLKFPLNFWLIAPGLKRKDFPEKLALATRDRPNCKLDPDHYHRRGIPYQLYRCSNQGKSKD